MSSTTSQISLLQLVVVPTRDHERSLEFYEALGFERRNDVQFGDGHRWVELYPPGTVSGIVLVNPQPEDPAGIQTGILLNTDDIDATHAELRSRGVDVDAEIARAGSPARIRIGAVEMAEPQPPMFYFRDPDGNALLVVQPG